MFFIGSLPFTSYDQAFDFVSKYSLGLPFLPELPNKDSQEDMIQRVLYGIENKNWKPYALDKFTEKFKASSQLKIQVAGPFTVARAISISFDEFFPNYFIFLHSLLTEWIDYKNTLWVQLDEPYWSETFTLPENYASFLCSIRGMRKKTKVGIHNCQKKRPLLSENLLNTLDFISLDFSDEKIKEEESQLFLKRKKLNPFVLVMGLDLLKEEKKGASDALYSFPCGLANISLSEIDRTLSEAESSIKRIKI